MADGTFSPLDAGKSAVGPGSNTGQKSTLTAPIVDWCTVVLDGDTFRTWARKRKPADVLRAIFNTGTRIAVGALRDKPMNFYPRSAVLVDETNTVCGHLMADDNGRMCISLSGQGCQHVPHWPAVADKLDEIGGRLSRVDIAIDDLTGETFDIQTFKNLHTEGAFMNNGRPPLASFVDDLGSNKGCSLYIGQKGHKQLNVYEKGKQLGDPESGHTRCELRLYAKRLDLPTDALRTPGKFFAGAYPLLAAYVIDEAEKLLVKHQIVNATAKAMVGFLRTQAGTSLQLVMDALGDDAVEFLMEHVVRPGRPGRFKGITGDLAAHVRAQLQTTYQPEAA